MKKILTLVIAALSVVGAFAQMSIVPKVGASLSKVAIEEDAEMKSKLGMVLGIGLNYKVNDLLSVQPEIQFVQRGFKFSSAYNVDGTTEKTDGSISINYLEIPVLIRTSFGRDNFKFFVNAGPSLGVGLGGKSEFKYSYSDGFTDFSFSSSGKVKFGEEPDDNENDTYIDNRIDLGLQLGAGFLIANRVVIDARYGLGLTNLFKKEAGMTSEEAKSKNRVIQFTVGIPFPMDK